MKKNRSELLAPAGSLDALYAAIEGGADAIYVGGTAFNARINAKNFTPEELTRGISCAHSYGVKVYIAANTLIYDRELEDYLRAAEQAYLAGADALIVADIGAARLLKDRIPIELHASTQLSGHNTEAAILLRDAGFSRMVCAREMSREDIKSFCESSPIEAEVFVHGALCVSHSGQCLFSSVVGGRSGNRGECAQPCRLPYRTPKGKTDYPLSLSDLSLARYIPELMDMGVASFKIEGRMKSPEYVRDVTRIWRRLIDERRGADEGDMAELASVFSRGGFTDGYYTGNIGRKMLGVRSDSDKESSRQLEPFTKITRKIPVTLEAKVVRGEPISLIARCGNTESYATGEIPSEAINAPLDRERVIQCFSKLGGTNYELASIDLTLDDGLMLPISSLNALRRKAIEGLEPKNERSKDDMVSLDIAKTPKNKRERMQTAFFFDPKAIPEEAKSFFDVIYTPIEKYNGETNGVSLPPVVYDSDMEKMKTLIDRARSMGAEHILIGNLGHLALARESGMRIHGDFRLNISNNYSAGYIEELGFEDMILSPELTMPRLRDIKGKSSAVVYGRLPLMITEKCIGKEIGDCDACNAGKLTLVDRKGISFPVLQSFGHRSIIVNSLPHYMADRSKELDSNGITMSHFIFTVESKAEVAKVIDAYKRSLAPANNQAVKRIK